MNNSVQPAQFDRKYASIFQDQSVVNAYRFRPVYPPQVFEFLEELLPATCSPRTVLDAGCGTGFIARTFVPRVDRLDAVDISAAAIAAGRQLPGGDHPRLRWIEGLMEEAPLEPPYCLITAGASLHWMEWKVVMPRFARSLAEGGVLALVGINLERPGWFDELRPLFARYSMNRDFQPYSEETILATMEEWGLFRRLGKRVTDVEELHQPLEEWIESFHARNGLSRDRMDPAHAAAFDEGLRRAAQANHPDGTIPLRLTGQVIWGHPLPGSPCRGRS